MYLNPEWIKINQEYVNIISKYGGTGEDLTPYLNETDNEIVLTINEPPISLADSRIDVDESGYVTSRALRQFGIYWCLFLVFDGFTGSGSGNYEDIYG